jgi:hypothetical protein
MVARFNDRNDIHVAREHSDKTSELIEAIKDLKSFLAPVVELAHVQLALLKGPSAPPDETPTEAAEGFLQ